jgi:hypothetical protein
MRYRIIEGGGYGGGGTLKLLPNFVFMQQGNQREINVGTAVEYDFRTNPMMGMSLGGWYRVNDALILGTSFLYDNYKLGISYDVTVHNYKVATNYKGGLEVSFTYTFGERTNMDQRTASPSPRF